VTYYSSRHVTQYGWITGSTAGSTAGSTEFSAAVSTVVDISIQYEDKIH